MFLWLNHSDDEGEPDDEDDEEDEEDDDDDCENGDDGEDDASDNCNEDDEEDDEIVKENGIIKGDSPEKQQSPVRWHLKYVINTFYVNV